MATNRIDKKSRIAIVGAGPAGLSTAWFLAKNGYDNVTVFEKLGRVGGLCKSITIRGKSFDLGANYLTWGYTETLRIAKEVRSRTYAEKPYISIKLPKPDEPQKVTYRKMADAVLRDPKTDEKIPAGKFIWAALRYLIIRFGLRSVIDRPGAFAVIDGTTQQDLVIPFEQWLTKNRLEPLETLFSFPITIMGYGKLSDIATPYALKYMSVKTFFPMVATSIPVLGWLLNTLFRWPKRFTMGFQRLWEKVAWRTNVRLNIEFTNITRSPDGPISISFKYPRQELNELEDAKDCMEFDYLVLACPLTPDVFCQLKLERNDFEKCMSETIRYNDYCMTTYWVDVHMPKPVAPVLPIPGIGKPWAVARQFQDNGNNFTQFYSLKAKEKIYGIEKVDTAQDDEIEKAVKEMVSMMGGEIDPTHTRWHSFDKFTYFQHVTCEDWKSGFYPKLAAAQGSDRTFYVGGVATFELVEPIVEHAKHIVESRFVGAGS